ncbi:uncharacterized protein At2g39795, mitochondrial-like [Hordeum vulgare subsp. vulgare]|uniref:Uncharacterized protein n=1 Tax=Hordeum vulgare subsp. vulgare TaxID=112509 RepID=A0A8I6X3X7_HORVV|nr:uncharacterized protein At2g39795, mitochondrial-like [Hordeum vulgare subsp. vulgare]
MALLAARRAAAALVRPSAAAAILRHTPAGARFSSAPDYRPFVRGLREGSEFLRAEKEQSSRPSAAELRAKADSLRAATHDGEIVGVLNSVIQSHRRDLVKGIPKDFPFEMSRTDGIPNITLTRSLNGEQIEVLVSMPKLDQDEDCDVGLQEDEAEISPEEYSIPVRVTVSKADGSSLEFTCTANPDNIVIETLFMRRNKSSGAEDAVASEGKEHDLGLLDDEGPHFHELDKNLQEAFHQYLEVRGITPMTAKLLREHMMSEDSHLSPKEKSDHRRRHLLWLMKLWDFVKKD